jgi:hypothetical protein
MSQTPIQTTYPAGKILQITVPPTVTIADKQYTFLQWEDRSTNITRNITVNGNLALAATYVTPSQAGFPLWAIPIAAGAVIIMYFMREKDKKKKR